MGFLTDWLTDWLKELLIEGIMGNLTGLFDSVNSRVGEIAVQVGTTPAAWNAGVFSLIRQLSETVILPIAGLILTFVATYELIQLIIEKNNLHDLDYWIFFKWIFKTACAILILSNTFNIVMAVFDVSQKRHRPGSRDRARLNGYFGGHACRLEATLETLGLGSLLGLWLQSLLIHVTHVGNQYCDLRHRHDRDISRVQKRRFSSKGGARTFWESGFSKPVKKKYQRRETRHFSVI